MIERPEQETTNVLPFREANLEASYQAGVRDSISAVEEATLNSELILSEIPDPERAREYIEFAEHLLGHLSGSEKIEFAKNPLKFVSTSFAFRGLTSEKYDRLQATRVYQPESGHFGSRGVYLSNSPYDAFTYQRLGVIAMIEVKNLQTLNGRGFHEVGSDLYKAHTQAYMNALPSTLSKRERSDALYSADEGIDLLEKTTSLNPATRNIVARQSQPIEVTDVFFVWKNGALEEERVQLAA